MDIMSIKTLMFVKSYTLNIIKIKGGSKTLEVGEDLRKTWEKYF